MLPDRREPMGRNDEASPLKPPVSRQYQTKPEPPRADR
jgi:hypothetical protein